MLQITEAQLSTERGGGAGGTYGPIDSKGKTNSVINIHRKYCIKLSILYLRINMTSLEVYQENNAPEEKDLGINEFLDLVVMLDLKFIKKKNGQGVFEKRHWKREGRLHSDWNVTWKKLSVYRFFLTFYTFRSFSMIIVVHTFDPRTWEAEVDAPL